MEANATDRRIAALISLSKDPPDWLILATCKARLTLTCTLRKDGDYPGRAEWRKRLETLKSAAKEVRAALEDFDTHALLWGPNEYLFNDVPRYDFLDDLDERISARLNDIPSRQGRDKYYPRSDGATPQENCALMISCLWEKVHSTPPHNTSDDAQRACAALWKASGGSETGRWGATVDRESVSVWRDHLRTAKELASSKEAEFFRRSLVEDRE
jgi:hypothetical protein